MKEPGKNAALVLALASTSLLGIALLQTFDRYREMLLWKKTEATVLERRIAFTHDGEGVLRYRVRSLLRYRTPSGEYRITADSDLESPEFALVRSRLNRMPPGSNLTVYYDPARHDTARFGAEFTAAYLSETLYYYIGSLLVAVAAAVVRSAWKQQQPCGGCRNKLKHHYRYCPYCGASRPDTPHLMSHERTVET
jgi:hypothetical protein